ncbi:hypothetical protein [Bradyrhizobium sp.]
MTAKQKLELLFLHALRLDGSMRAGQQQLLPGLTHAPTLYPLGDSIEARAEPVLRIAKGDRRADGFMSSRNAATTCRWSGPTF